MEAQTQIPAGFMQDANGNLIHEDNIKPLDLMRDDLVRQIVGAGLEVAKEVDKFKSRTEADIAALISLAAEKHGVTIGGKQGNVTLYSFDGKYKIIRQNAKKIKFDEQLIAAQKLIYECVHEWTEGSNKNVKALIDKAFEMDRDGNISSSRVLGLCSLNIDDMRWKRAIDAIKESIMVIGTKSYVRLYQRVGQTEEYVPIALS